CSCVVLPEQPEPTRRGVHVFIAPSGQVDQQYRFLGPLLGQVAAHPQGTGDGVGALQGRNDAFGAAQDLEGVHGLVIGDRLVGGPAGVVQPGMFGADAGIVQSGGDGVARQGLPVGVLQQVGPCAVQYSGRSAAEPCGVLPAGNTATACLESVQGH